jgi:hypothetical protein
VSAAAAELLAAIRAADRHEGGLRFLRLLGVEPAFFATLRGEVERLVADEQPSSVSRPGHVTGWTGPYGDVLQYSLLNRSSRYDDWSSDHDLSCFGKRFRDEERYPALGRLVAELPHLVNARVSVLGPGAGLSPHEEHSVFETAAGTLAVRARLHLPVVTNPHAELTLDGAVHHLRAGVVHFVNHGCVHAAVNAGRQPRIHLIFDELLTAEAFDVLFGAGPPPGSPLEPLAEEARRSVPLREEPVGPARRLDPDVPPSDERVPELCEPQ